MSRSQRSGLSTACSALVRTGRFVFANSVRLIPISICWFVVSLPIVTVGPATLGAYVAIGSVRERGHVDRENVFRAVRRNWVDAMLLGLLPVLLAALAVLYGIQYASTMDVRHLLLGWIGATLSIYSLVILPPVFGNLASGDELLPAIVSAVSWTASRPTLSVLSFAFTAATFVITIALTVAFVLLFPAVVFSYHLLVHELTEEDNQDSFWAPRNTT